MASVPPAEYTEGRQLPPLPCLEASELIRRTTDRAFHDVRRLANILSRVNLDTRREDLLDYVRLNRARFVKTYATISWLAGSHGELVVNAGNALAEARSQREHIDMCQDQFFFMHGALFGARQRLYDVPVAVDVLVGGRYPWLPKGIQYCGGDIDPRSIFELPADRDKIVRRVDRAIRLALLTRGGVPTEFTDHNVRNGVLTLIVEAEFELVVTLDTERDDAPWSLLGATVHVTAREGEAITQPTPDFRQQRYLYEVVQKAMDGQSHADEAKLNPLRAAYEVCHDLCCSMVLEILHAQAETLSTRVGGLWGTQLAIAFDKDAQVLDLCLWRGEFSTGLGGTGREVGVGGVLASDALFHRQPAVEGISELPRVAAMPPAPIGCRYVRVHRPAERNGQIAASLGPFGEVLGGSEWDSGGGDLKADGEGAGAGVVLTGAVHVHPDKLSCAQMLLAAARVFASQKITALVADVEQAAQQLGTCIPRAAVVGGVNAYICPWRDQAVEVSVDVKTGRYVVKNTLSSSSKAMSKCMSRLGDALNLLPRTDTQSLGTSITAALSAGRNMPLLSSLSNRSARNGEQQDLRRQQVRQCVAECFGLLRRGEVENVLRCKFGLTPHQRWQALLGRADTIVESSLPDSCGTLRTFVCLGQFREQGVRLSDEWRSRSRSYRLARRGASVIELTKAERAATVGQVPFGTTPPGVGLGLTAGGSLSGSLDMVGGCFGQGTLPGLAASLAEGSDAGDDTSIRALLPVTGDVDPLEINGVNVMAAGDKLTATGEVVSFFLEVGVTEHMNMEYTLIAATLSTARRAGASIRPDVGETYRILPGLPLKTSRCVSLEAARLPDEPASAAGVKVQLLGKRPSSCVDVGGLDAKNGTNSAARPLPYGAVYGVSHGDHGDVRPAKKFAFASLFGGPLEAVQPESIGSPPGSVTDAEVILHTAVQMGKRLVPFARLQHALLRVGTGLSLDFHGLTHFLGTLGQATHCQVFLAGEDGWSSPELAATTARVNFLAGHTQADSWEWDVSLECTTLVMDYVGPGAATAGDRAMAAALKAVRRYLPLVRGVEVGCGEESVAGPQSGIGKFDGGTPVAGQNGGQANRGGGKCIRFRFPSSFSVHAMCRSFAMAGEGLAAMRHLTCQASKLLKAGCAETGYGVVSFSPIHVAVHDRCSDHVILLTHSAFSARHIALADHPGLVLIPLPDVPTCPAAMRELEAAVRKHRDLSALLHGLSRTIGVLEQVARVVPGVGRGLGTSAGDTVHGDGKTTFVLTAISPACFVLSARSCQPVRVERRALTLMIGADGQIRVSGGKGGNDTLQNIAALRDLLLDWIASNSACDAE